VDAANGVSPVAAGSYVSIYGTGMVDSFYFPNTLGQSGDSATTPILPLNIDGVTVSWDYPAGYDGTPAHYNGAPGFLTYVSPGQINLQVPWEMQGKSSAQVKVTIDGISPGNVVTVPMATYAPAFFLNSGTVADALDYPNYHLITLANPAKRGAVIQLYVNGLGPVSNQPASGTPALASPLSQTPQNPIVSIGNQPAQVVFSGLAPGFPGLYQVNVVVAANTPTGSQPITISIGGVTSPATVGGRQVILPVQ
jgi:minor extracellular serine protease Vpr